MKGRIVIFVALLLSIACSAKVKKYNIKVESEYPHDVGSYTQGLFFHEGRLIETTGIYGKSTLREVDLSSGKPINKVQFNKKYFVEGSTIFKDELYILTWTNNVAFVYDIQSLKYKRTLAYPREGWGLTTDGKQLIASDGSSTLYFMNENFEVSRRLSVTLNGRALRFLNELEYIDGKIWANVYTTDVIVIIDPNSGNVEGMINCAGLLDNKLRRSDTDVLNGIALNKEDGRIYITGKNWPRMYEITLIDD